MEGVREERGEKREGREETGEGCREEGGRLESGRRESEGGARRGCCTIDACLEVKNRTTLRGDAVDDAMGGAIDDAYRL